MSDKGNKLTEQLSQAWAITRARITPLKLMICAAILVTAFLIYWGWKGFASEDIDVRGAAFSSFGLPILAIWGICLAVWRSTIAERQANAAAQQAKVAAQQSDIAFRSLQNDRYQKGAEMLGSKELPVRVGGINVLKRLAQDDPETYHREIMALFSFFARNPTPDAELEQAASSEEGQDRLRPDVEAIIQAIGQRNTEQQKLDVQGMEDNKDLATIALFGVDLRGALLFDANLSWIWVVSSNLTGASLSDANLTGSVLSSSNLTNADLAGVDLTDANLTDANLTGVRNLTQEQLDKACQSPEGEPPHDTPVGLKWNKDEAIERWKKLNE